MAVAVPQEKLIVNLTGKFYMDGFSGLASFTGRWIDTAMLSCISFNIWWTAVAATAGTLAIQASNDMTMGVDPNASGPTAESITTLTLTAPTGGSTLGVHGNSGSLAVGASASSVVIIMEKLPKFLRVSYTRSAGGGSGQFFGSVYGKSL